MLTNTLGEVLATINEAAKGSRIFVKEGFGIVNVNLIASRKMSEVESIAELTAFAKDNKLTPSATKKLLTDVV